MRERASTELVEFAARDRGEVDDVVLLGMGGSSLAPEVLAPLVRRVERFTSSTRRIRRRSGALETASTSSGTLFVAASKSGHDARDAVAHGVLLAATGQARFAAITDPGSELEPFAREREVPPSCAGEPTIGGRYSALSLFGLVPAALMGVDVVRLLDRARRDA